MSPEQIEGLRERRRALMQQLEELRASDKVQRHAGTSSARCGHPTSWRQAVRATEALIAQIDKVLIPLDRVQPARSVKADPARGSQSRHEWLMVLARMPNTPRSEIRVSIRRQGDGRFQVDVRVWRLMDGADAIPTLKGVIIDHEHLPGLLTAVQSAGQYIAPAHDQG